MKKRYAVYALGLALVLTGCSSGTTSNSTSNNSSSSVVETNSISYSSSGFSPSNIAISVGTTVTFTNDGGSQMWPASDVHPTHKEYDGTSLSQHCAGGSGNSFDACGNVDEYSFTFDKVGTWEYHNHSRSAHTGTVTVTN